MAFFGIQILQNSISAGAPPRSPLAELTTLLQILWSVGEGIPPPHSLLPRHGVSLSTPSDTGGIPLKPCNFWIRHRLRLPQNAASVII